VNAGDVPPFCVNFDLDVANSQAFHRGMNQVVECCQPELPSTPYWPADLIKVYTLRLSCYNLCLSYPTKPAGLCRIQLSLLQSQFFPHSRCRCYKAYFVGNLEILDFRKRTSPSMNHFS